MPKPQEVAAIIVNGQQYRDWKTVSVSREFENPIAQFAFTAASPAESGPNWAGIKLKVGDRGTVTLGGAAVVSGVVDVRQVAYDARQHGLQIHGLSIAQDIVYGTVDPNPGEYKNYSLSQIANSVLAPYGLSFRLEGDTSGADKPFPKVNVQVGETVFSFLERLCRFRNVFLIDDGQGSVVGYRSGSDANVVAELQEGRNILTASLIMSDEQALGKIEARGQRPGNDDHWGDDARDVTGTVTNTATTRHRPLIFMAEMPGDQDDMQMRAQHELATNYATMVQGNIKVQGWFTDDGTPWIQHVGKNVSVYSPMIFPDDRMTLAIQGVTHSQSEAGTVTDINLVLPGRLGGTGFIGTGPDGSAPGLFGGAT